MGVVRVSWVLRACLGPAYLHSPQVRDSTPASVFFHWGLLAKLHLWKFQSLASGMSTLTARLKRTALSRTHGYTRVATRFRTDTQARACITRSRTHRYSRVYNTIAHARMYTRHTTREIFKQTWTSQLVFVCYRAVCCTDFMGRAPIAAQAISCRPRETRGSDIKPWPMTKAESRRKS